MPELSDLRRRLTTACATAGPASGLPRQPEARESLIRTVYRRVHCRLRWAEGEPWSQRQRLATLLENAQIRLGARPSRFGNLHLVQMTPCGPILRTDDQIDVVAPPRGELITSDAEVALQAAPVALSADGRWLHLLSPHGSPTEPVRIYLNARSAHAFAAWLAIAEALHGTGLQTQVKVAGSARLCHRADSVVVYCDTGDLPDVLRVLSATIQPRWLASIVPGFGCRIRPGVALGVTRPDDRRYGSAGHAWSVRTVDAYMAGTDQLSATFDSLAALWAQTRAIVPPLQWGDD